MLKINFKNLFFCGASSLVAFSLASCSFKQVKTTDLASPLPVIKTIEAVAALGQIIPFGEVRKLAAPVSGFGGTPRIAKLFVNEGDSVELGQKLATFDNRERVLADLNVANVRLKTINHEIIRKKSIIDRYEIAVFKGAIAIIEFETEKDDLIKLEGQKAQIIEEIKGLKSELDHSQLKSPVNGVVLRVIAREGERPGIDGVLEVGANSKMEALVEVYESDIDRVKLGQIVNLTSENGGFDGTLSGTVFIISPQVRQRRVFSTDPTGDADSRIVEVRVRLDTKSTLSVSRLTGMKVIARFLPF